MVLSVEGTAMTGRSLGSVSVELPDCFHVLPEADALATFRSRDRAYRAVAAGMPSDGGVLLLTGDMTFVALAIEGMPRADASPTGVGTSVTVHLERELVLPVRWILSHARVLRALGDVAFEPERVAYVRR